MIVTVAVVDLLYGCFVSPFFVENYVNNNWEQSSAYCSFYTFFFTFHDLFAPLCLICLSIYISLKFTGQFPLSIFDIFSYLANYPFPIPTELT